MTFVAGRPFADPEIAARKFLEIASSLEPVQDGRIHIEKINWAFLSELAVQPNTAPASSSRSSASGGGCTRAGPM